MVYTVHISKNALDYFRQKARSTSLEVQAYLIGEINYPDKIIVDSIQYPKKYAIQTAYNVAPTAFEFRRVKLLAERQGRRIVGDIHSHPNAHPIMSLPDYKAALEDGMYVCGIVGVMGRKTHVEFWTVNSALPCEISYEEIQGTSEVTEEDSE